MYQTEIKFRIINNFKTKYTLSLVAESKPEIGSYSFQPQQLFTVLSGIQMPRKASKSYLNLSI